ncbi:hypothetical protein Trydic_g7220 [Trypoxylus dichotomus]
MKTEIEVDDYKFKTLVDLVPEGSGQIKCLEQEDFTMLITLDDEEEIHANLNQIGDKSCIEPIRMLIKRYKPECTKKTQIQTKIILKDETPISHIRRRMSTYEKDEVENHIEE